MTVHCLAEGDRPCGSPHVTWKLHVSNKPCGRCPVAAVLSSASISCPVPPSTPTSYHHFPPGLWPKVLPCPPYNPVRGRGLPCGSLASLPYTLTLFGVCARVLPPPGPLALEPQTHPYFLCLFCLAQPPQPQAVESALRTWACEALMPSPITLAEAGHLPPPARRAGARPSV